MTSRWRPAQPFLTLWPSIWMTWWHGLSGVCVSRMCRRLWRWTKCWTYRTTPAWWRHGQHLQPWRVNIPHTNESMIIHSDLSTYNHCAKWHVNIPHTNESIIIHSDLSTYNHVQNDALTIRMCMNEWCQRPVSDCCCVLFADAAWTGCSQRKGCIILPANLSSSTAEKT